MAGCRRRKRLLQRLRKQTLRRRDFLSRMVVDIGLEYRALIGLEKSRSFLRAQAIPEAVILRVLPQDEAPALRNFLFGVAREQAGDHSGSRDSIK